MICTGLPNNASSSGREVITILATQEHDLFQVLNGLVELMGNLAPTCKMLHFVGIERNENTGGSVMGIFPLRSKFFWLVAISVVFVFAGFPAAFSQEKQPVSFELLPYAQAALEPYISSYTLGFHHGKHHAAYVTKANELLKSSPLVRKPIEEIIRETAGKDDQAALFNVVAQSWNHAFFWKCLKPGPVTKPMGKLAELIDEQFGSFQAFQEKFLEAGKSLFGSGWVWLVLDGGNLKIVTTSNAGNPLTNGQKPLLVIDVWEHSYYLDYQNRRPDYLKAIMGNLVNWEFVASNL